VIKRTEKKRVVEITRTLVVGDAAHAQELLTRTKGCAECNTSLIERLNRPASYDTSCCTYGVLVSGLSG